MPACQICGVEHDAGARFCSACGAPTFQLCAVCGAESPAGASFCSACGAGLRDGARRGEPVAAADERRVVTILFADLAGSTALGEQLDPEDVRDVQGRLFDVVDAEVTRFGGVSEKFAGDAVMAVFGIPQAHEDDAERAVLAALAIQRRFPDLAERVRTLHGSEVALRIGVNTGEVVTGRDSAARGEMMVSGDAVNVAARLQQHAEPGAVLVGERTMSASRGAIGYGTPTELQAKGKSAPLPAWPAQRALDRPRRRGIEGLRAPMVGRDQELALLITLAGRVAEERAPQVVTLLGVAGVGKTRLLDELAVRVPARVLRGRCIPYGEGVAYWPLAEVAKAEAGILDSDSAAESLEKLRAAFGGDSESAVQAAAWTIGLDTGSIEVESDVVRRRLHDHWTRYLATAAAAGPVLLVIEDIHWASTEMLDLIERLAARLEDAPVMILCSSRPELLESRRSWGAGLPNATTVSLTPLRAEQARLLLAELLELGRMPDDALERILARAEGNPFYIEEILRMLIDRGAIERAGSGWRSTDLLADMPIPDSVHGVIAARIDLLDAPSRDALRRCSVIGRRFWPDAVGVSPDLVSGIGGGLVAENAESAMGAMREFSYRHALTRDVAYSSLSRPERRELHVQVADWIVRLSVEQGREDSELIADHLIRAIENGADDPLLFRQAVDAQRRAGQAALARGAAQSALPMLMRAHELSDDPAEQRRIDLLIAEAAVHASAGELVQERLQPLLEQAERDADDGLLADVLPLLSRAHWILGDYDRAAETAARAVAVLGEDADDAQRAHAVARHAQIQMLRSIPEAEQNAEIALELARRVGDRGLEANTITTLLTIRGQAGVPIGADVFHAALNAATESGNADEIPRALVNYAWVAQADIPIAELEETFRIGEAAADAVEAGDRFLSYVTFTRCLYILVPTGRWDEVDDAFRRWPHPETNPLMLSHWLAVELAIRRGRLHHADRLLPEAVAMAERTSEPQRIIPISALDASRGALLGDVARVRAAAERTIAAIRGRTAATSFTEHPLPRALARVGDVEMLDRMLALYAEEVGEPRMARLRAAGLALHGFRALAAGDGATAVPLFTQVREMEAARGAVVHAADVDLDLAAAFELAGDPAAAAEARARAAAVYEPLAAVNSP
jgi:class 3 adenylate cyclase